MKNQVLLTLAIFVLIGCHESDDIRIESVDTKHLTFNDHNDFMKTVDLVGTLNDRQLDEWEKKKGFVSYRTVLSQAYKESEQITTENELSQFLSRYSDVLSLQDSALVPKIKATVYQSLSDRHGFY